MTKPLLIIFVILAAGLIAYLYEQKSISNQIQPVMQYWIIATQQAKFNNLSTEEFYALHDDKGKLIDDQLFGQRLRQQVLIDSMLCSSIDVDVIYKVSTDDSANLVSIIRQSDQGLC